MSKPEKMWLRVCGGGTTMPGGRIYTTMVGDDFQKPNHELYVRGDLPEAVTAALAGMLEEFANAEHQNCACVSCKVMAAARAALAKARGEKP